MLNIHVMPDHFFSRYFIDKICEIGALGCNLFIIESGAKYSSSINCDIDGLKRQHPGKVLSYKTGELYSVLVKSVTKDSSVYFHGLGMEGEKCIIKIKEIEAVTIGWVYWGEMVLYSRYKERSFFYSKKTRGYISRKEWQSADILKRVFLTTGLFYIREYFNSVRNMRRRICAIKKIDFFLHWNRYDYLKVAELYDLTDSMPEFKDFSYGEYLEDIQMEGEQEKYRYSQNYGNNRHTINVMVGHSAHLSLNHFDAFTMLSEQVDCRVDCMNVYCILVYGSTTYKSCVIEKGKELFGKRFFPITERVSLEEYFKFLRTIDVALFPIKHSAAGGNIAKLLSFGKIVCIDADSTLYNHFKHMGFRIYNLDEASSSLSKILSNHDGSGNVQLFKKVFNIDSINNVYKERFYLEMKGRI